ncbi:MAG: hypothetical protein AAFR84_09010 [Pseudomonadota bacterium]
MTAELSAAIVERASAVPDAAAMISALLALAIAFLGPLPHAARVLLRLAQPRAKAVRIRALTSAAIVGLRAGILVGPAAGWMVLGGPGAIFATLAAASLLLALCDLRWRWLPLEWTGSVGASGLALAFAAGQLTDALLAATTLMLVLAAVQAGFFALRGVHGLGTGDIFLTGAIAAHLGTGATAIVLATAAMGALLMQSRMIRDISATRNDARPIPLGAWIALCFVCSPGATMLL